ncbi:MAG: hypothetical protein KAR44_07635 [Candidatus Aegiribacteria sp.]|nr:hypothetical protein [Candidatus Aegiribacteria sp.]
MINWVNILTSVLSGSVAAGFAVWLIKNIVQERIKQSIENEYKVNLEHIKANLKVRSDYEAGILSSHIEKYWDLGEIINTITHQSLQLLSWAISTYQMELRSGKTVEESNKTVSISLNQKAMPIIETAMNLKKYYVFLPSEVIEKLKHFESIVWSILKEGNFEEPKELLISSDDLLCSIRLTTAQLISNEIELSDVLRNLPEGGFMPDYIKHAVEKS